MIHQNVGLCDFGLVTHGLLNSLHHPVVIKKDLSCALPSADSPCYL